MPETGMGYQIISAAREERSSKEYFVAYNGQMTVDLDEKFITIREHAVARLKTHYFNDLKNLRLDINSIETVSKADFNKNHALLERAAMAQYKQYESHGRGATDSVHEHADGESVFVRLSAYEDDIRIDTINQRLMEGSYTTTHSDYTDCVRINDDPVDRYALPSTMKPEWAFYIRPRQGDLFQKGIVQPAFGHRGGGEEAFFKNGTSNNTLLGKRSYGQ